MTKQQTSLIDDARPLREGRGLIDRCATSAPATIIVAAALMVPVVALIEALRG